MYYSQGLYFDFPFLQYAIYFGMEDFSSDIFILFKLKNIYNFVSSDVTMLYFYFQRRERDLEHEMERLAREKISAQQRLVVLKKEISAKYDGLDFSRLLPEIPPLPPRPSPEHSPPPLPPSQPEQHTTVVVQHEGSNERVPIPALPRQQQNIQFLNGTKEVIN